MDFCRYIYDLRNFNPHDMTDVDLFFLETIFKGKYNSAYKMCKYISEKEDKKSVISLSSIVDGLKIDMDIKNVRKRFIKLKELGLIEDTTEGYSVHGAKYYRITDLGIMYVDPELYLLNNSEFKQVKHTALWRHLISQFFEKETIRAIRNGSENLSIGEQLIPQYEILVYLRKCIEDTIKGLKLFRYTLKRNHIDLSQDDLDYYFKLVTKPELYKNNLRNNSRESQLIWDKIDEFEDRFLLDQGDNSAGFFKYLELENMLKWNIKYLVFRWLCNTKLVESPIAQILRMDKSFMSLVKEIHSEFNHGTKALGIMMYQSGSSL